MLRCRQYGLHGLHACNVNTEEAANKGKHRTQSNQSNSRLSYLFYECLFRNFAFVNKIQATGTASNVTQQSRVAIAKS